MTSLLPADFKFEIQLGDIPPEQEQHFEGLKTSASIPKVNITHFSKLVEAAKMQLKESITKLAEVMQMGTDISQLECYFTQAKSKDGQDNKTIITRSDLNKMLPIASSSKRIELVIRIKKKDEQ